jgi:group I intron endonuclease
MGYIYKITNTVNNKAYIGVTVRSDVEHRWVQHRSTIRNGNGCPLLMKAFKKYGEDAFKFDILIICFDEDVFRFENDYIIKYNTMSPNGYNVAVGGLIGMSFLGRKHTEETKKILREKTKARSEKPEARERASRVAIEFNKTHDIGELLRKSEKWKKALAEGRVGGHAQTEEGKKKISDGLKKYYKNNTVDMTKQINAIKKANSKKVIQYSIDGKMIISFDSMTIAESKTGVTRRNIQNNISGRSKTAGGFIWKYAEPKDISLVEQQNQEGSQLAL